MVEEKTLLHAVLVFPVTENEIMLGIKAAKIGAGKRNGWGGGIEAGENPIQAAIREFSEEAEAILLPEYLLKAAVVDFHNKKSNGEEFICRVHVYFSSKWIGEIRETGEMSDPRLFPKDQIPLEEMMPADKDWLIPALSGKKIYAEAYLGPFQKELLGKTLITEVNSFEQFDKPAT